MLLTPHLCNITLNKLCVIDSFACSFNVRARLLAPLSECVKLQDALLSKSRNLINKL